MTEELSESALPVPDLDQELFRDKLSLPPVRVGAVSRVKLIELAWSTVFAAQIEVIEAQGLLNTVSFGSLRVEHEVAT